MVRVDISSKEYRPFTFYQDFKIAARFIQISFEYPSIPGIIILKVNIGANGSLQPRFSSSRFNLSMSKKCGSKRHPFNRA